MALVLMAGPAAEPVTIDEAKTHLRVDGGSEDAFINSLILTSRLHIEAALGLALMTQNWTLLRDRWPEGTEVPLMLRPVLSVDAVRVLDAGGAATVIDPETYVADVASAAPRLVRAGANWPRPGRMANGIEIEMTAGYGATAADVPAPIRHALLLLIAHWYEHRDPIEIGTPSVAIPAAVSRLLKPYRMARI